MNEKHYSKFSLDESELIDWEKDSDSTDECDESEKDDSSLEISDTDSCTNLNSLPVKEENDELCKVRNYFLLLKVVFLLQLCSVFSFGCT